MGNGNRPTPEFSREGAGMALTRGRTRRENSVLKQKRDIQRSRGLLRERRRPMAFGFLEAEQASCPIRWRCRVPAVRQSGVFACQERPACRRQPQDPVCLAPIRTAFASSNGTYGGPRMPSPSCRTSARSVLGWATRDRLNAIWQWTPCDVPSWLAPRAGAGPSFRPRIAICSVDDHALLRRISMSGRGKGHDTRRVATFVKTIKSERIWPVAWQSRQQAENAVAKNVDGFYIPSGGPHHTASKAPSPLNERPGT